jgi:hypothetical protein
MSKGFREESGGHRRLFLYVDGERTSVWTEVSHGEKQYCGNLLVLVKRELKLGSIKDVQKLIDCPMTYDAYVSGLRKDGIIPRRGHQDAAQDGGAKRQGKDARGDSQKRRKGRRRR